MACLLVPLGWSGQGEWGDTDNGVPVPDRTLSHAMAELCQKPRPTRFRKKSCKSTPPTQNIIAGQTSQ